MNKSPEQHMKNTMAQMFKLVPHIHRYHQAKAEYEEAKLQYQDAALNAFREVSDSLVSHRRFDEERAEQIEAVHAGREAVATSTDRYKEGKASYYEVLEAQQQLFPAENALSHIEAARRLTIVQLYEALGGGWENMEPSARAKAQAAPDSR